MLKNGKCPQCGSSDIVTCQQGIGWDLNLMVTKGKMSVSSGAWTTYLCTCCGLFENYVTDMPYLGSAKSDPTLGWSHIDGPS
jgi:hypothetical protein